LAEFTASTSIVAIATTLLAACSNKGKNIFLSFGTKYWNMLFNDMLSVDLNQKYD
jgi:hypothetical protein